MTSQVPRPDVFHYLDFREFLRDWFAWKKSENRRYSHRMFVRKTGQKSPSLLVDVIEGRRNLSAVTEVAFASAMSLDEEETVFFRRLVHFNQADTQEERQLAWREISTSRRFRDAQQIEGAMYDCFARWYVMVIREMVSMQGFREDPAWIASQLRPPITEAQVVESLDSLLQAGLLERDEDGKVVPSDPTHVTPPQVSGVAVHDYHLGMLSLAQRAVREIPMDERHFLGMTLAVPTHKLDEIKAELTKTSRRLFDLCSEGSEEADAVIQLHVHFFPLTQPAQDE